MDSTDDPPSIVLKDTPSADYNQMLEKKPEELEFMRTECEVLIEDLKGKILTEYHAIRPGIERMKQFKAQLNKMRERHETISMFLSLDRASFQLMDADALQKSGPATTGPSRSVQALERVLKDMLTDEDSHTHPARTTEPPPSPASEVAVAASPKRRHAPLAKAKSQSRIPLKRPHA